MVLNFFASPSSGSESPAPFVEKGDPLSTSLKAEGERYRQLSKMLIKDQVKFIYIVETEPTPI